MKQIYELKKELYAPPIAFGVSFNLQSQSLWSVFDGPWQKRRKELDYPTEEIYVQPIAFDVLFISICNLNLMGLCSTERGKRDLEIPYVAKET